MKQKLVLIASVVCGLIAFFLTGHYLKTEKDKLYKGAETIKILAAARDLPAGTELDPAKDIGMIEVFKKAVGDNVCRVEDLDTLRGKKLIYPIAKRNPIMWSLVDMPDRARYGLAASVKHGMRAVSINASGSAAVSGLVQPNDRVDILGTFTFPSRKKAGETESVTLTVLQDVTVLATGTKLGKAVPGQSVSSGGGSYNAVTLEVTPREAEVLVFAQHVRGQLLLSLRNDADGSYEKSLPEVDFKLIEENLPQLNEYRQNNIRKNLNR
jgi:pilus assembly protein CpaB